MAKVGIVISARTGAVRRWIVPDADADLIDKHPVAKGEAMVLVDQALIPSDLAKATAFIAAAVKRVVGSDPPVPRCVVVDTDTGLVKSAVMADPLLDQHADGHIVEDATADAGYLLLTNGTFFDPRSRAADALGNDIGPLPLPAGVQVAGSTDLAALRLSLGEATSLK